MDNLGALREEYAGLGIGPLLHELLSKIVWSTVRQYPPAEYSPCSNWDEPACEDILNDWVAERLWGRADLQAMLISAPTVAQLRAALTTSLRQLLSNKRRRSIASNLYKRIVIIMRSDPQFRPAGSEAPATERCWSVSESDGRSSSLSVDDLVQIAFQLSDDDLQVVRYGPFSQKLSPVLRDGKLREFLHFLLSKANGSLPVSTIVEVMRLRFSLPTEEHIELEDSIPSPDPSPASQAETAIAARSVVSRLGLDEAAILAAYFKFQGDFELTAQSCRRGVQRVREVVQMALTAICECSESEETARSIMAQVESLLVRRD